MVQCVKRNSGTRKKRREAASALALASTENVRLLSAVALARAGEIARAETLLKELEKTVKPGSHYDRYWLSTIRSAIEIDRGKPVQGLEHLEKASAYELGCCGIAPQATMYPVYVTHLGLARANAMQGDSAKAKGANQDFLTRWKDGDPDVPILKEAKSEYAKLQ